MCVSDWRALPTNLIDRQIARVLRSGASGAFWTLILVDAPLPFDADIMAPSKTNLPTLDSIRILLQVHTMSIHLGP